MKIKPDYWQSIYGGALEPGDDELSAKYSVELEAEVEASSFGSRVVPNLTALAGDHAIAFIDGVRRIDLHAIVEELPPCFGLFGSVAVGAMVLRPGQAHTLVQAMPSARVLRLFLTDTPDPEEKALLSPEIGAALGNLTYEVRVVRAKEPQALVNALIKAMSELEREVRDTLARDPAVRLVLADGPIRDERSPAPEQGKLAGLIKSMQQLYLPRERLGTVAKLANRERTHFFAIRYEDTPSSKFSFFVRIQENGRMSSAFSNLVRVEIPILPRSEAVVLADLVAAVAVHYASNLYADSRAPQNLYPVAALESALKNRLGDPRLLRGRILALLSQLS